MNSQTAVKQLMKLKKLVDGTEDVGRLAAEGWDEDWKCLIATMLSAQTKDTTTVIVSENLFKKFNSPKKLSLAKISEIEKIIRSVNYHKTKAKHVKETAKMISEKGIPLTVEKLIEFPGVGRKTANVFLAEAHGGQNIGVDTHVARLSQKLGWTKNNAPEKIEKDLENLFQKKYWNSINYILVRFGQTFGKSRKKEDELLKEIFIPNS
jgi:endonuclease-3